jgi:DNA-binding transcriptional ArsR family regulator
MLKNVHEVTYVPSVHIGPYMTLLDFDGSNAVIVGRARIPEGAPVSSPTIDRSDLLIRLEALSDTTRLRILEMAAKREVITSQDVIDELELSQSSASRHLTQLTATGLLKVDGSERTRRYRLNSDRIDAVCGGIKQLFAVAAGV